MQRLQMKIHEYDEESHSLIISFSSDKTAGGVDDYRRYAFSLANYSPSDIREAIHKIAIQGLNIAKNQYDDEQSKKSISYKKNAAQEVGKVYDFDINDLLPEGVIL